MSHRVLYNCHCANRSAPYYLCDIRSTTLPIPVCRMLLAAVKDELLVPRTRLLDNVKPTTIKQSKWHAIYLELSETRAAFITSDLGFINDSFLFRIVTGVLILR